MKPESGSEKGEDLDVIEVHGQLIREKSEPIELYRAVPGWLKHGIYAPLLIGGLIYLFSASGGFRWSEFYEGHRRVAGARIDSQPSREPAPEVPSVASASPVDLQREEGAKVYRSVCMACHQSNGQGLAGAFPPLADSDWVAGDEKRLVLLVLHGLMGPIEVNGEVWNGVMPGQGTLLDDEQIAAVLTYVRSEWGNDAPPVDVARVTELRAAHEGSPPWTAETLEAVAP